MTDIFSKEKRSEIMSLIKPRNTKPELKIFRELRRRNIYFQKHYDRIKGRPDIALPRKKIAIFIDGDFWHGYRFARYKARLPKKYWQGKIEGNIKRDKRNRSKLRREGWRCLRVWEHEIKKDFDRTVQKVVNFLIKGKSD